MSQHKRPRTRQETAINHLHAIEGIVKVRAKRLNLPDSYDDENRSDLGHKTWKRHRAAQYRAA